MSKQDGIRVPTGLHLQSRLFARSAGLWRRLGNLETSVLSDEIAVIKVSRPIYVTSLARAGTTIVTEMLEKHPDVTSHRYSDFPNVWTPYWRNHLLQSTRKETPKPQERAHRDRIKVSNDSPEAVEEVLWRHFFPEQHDSRRDQVLRAGPRNTEFDTFYQAHIRKLLAVRSADRYLAKGNYNIARLAYIRGLFADARFLIPLRDPVHHIASLAKQHRLFLESDRDDPRVARQLAMSGHFEFGPGRTFVNFGDQEVAEAIRDCWSEGREVEGWARYWAATYRHLAAQLDADPGLAEAVLLFRYESLCEDSEITIDALLEHCDLDTGAYAPQREKYSRSLSLPDYYQPDFSRTELDTIDKHCLPALRGLEKHLFTTV
jgi:hypothetical protein